MGKMKKGLFIIFIFVISVILFSSNVLAEEAYITYAEIKETTGSSTSYDGNVGFLAEYTMIDDGPYSFVITGYNLDDTEEYTYTLKSDYVDVVEKYTGLELENGVIVTGENGNGVAESKLVDKNNTIIKNKYNEVYYEKTNFVFNYNFDTTKIDNFYKQIVKDGKVKISAVDPKGDGAFAETAISASLQSMYETDEFWLTGGCYEVDKPCTMYISEKSDYNRSKEYQVEYKFVEADPKIKEKADKFAKKFNYNVDTIEKDLFIMEDLETINYKYAVSIHGDTVDTLNSIINYSSEFQKKLNNSNFSAILDTRAGWDDKFTSGGFGFLNLVHSGVIYSYAEVAGVKQNNVIYVPNNTKDTRDAYINTALERIKEYIPEADVKIEYAGQIADVDFEDQVLQLEDIVDVKKTLGEYYRLSINGDKYYFFIAKDSSKIKKPKMNTKDVNTDISISTESSDVPLDTKISAVIIDSNSKEYKEFLKQLKIKNGIVVDLKLFSESINKNISKLNNDKFKVYIPLTEEMKTLDLMAYYIKDNGEIEKYDITIDGDYLIFETNHFSTYIIGGNAKNSIKNPPTNDEIKSLITLSLISLSGIIIALEYKKKQNI